MTSGRVKYLHLAQSVLQALMQAPLVSYDEREVVGNTHKGARPKSPNLGTELWRAGSGTGPNANPNPAPREL